MDPMTMWAAASAGGALLNYFGTTSTNQANRDIAGDTTRANMEEAARNRAFQATSAKEQMEFQERMANTVHQREVEDLKKAGLNPILAAQGGAPAPSGASASGSQGSAAQAKMENPFADASSWISNALQAMQMAGGLEKQAAETDLIREQTTKTRLDRPESELKNGIWNWIKKQWNDSQRGTAPKTRKIPDLRKSVRQNYQLW